MCAKRLKLIVNNRRFAILVETFCDIERTAGTCYRTAGWKAVGRTKGFSLVGHSRDFFIKNDSPKVLYSNKTPRPMV